MERTEVLTIDNDPSAFRLAHANGVGFVGGID
jgi:hypothetical protein